MPSVRTVKQHYWFSPRLPQLESRSTWNSTHAYKTHAHAQLSLGAIVAGSTVCHYRDRDHLLRAGDLVLIDPEAPHSCNPLPGAARSYHMLYIDVTWCLARLAPLYPQPLAALCCRTTRIGDPALFVRYLRLIDSLYRDDLTAATRQFDALMSAVLPVYCVPQPPPPERPATRYIRRRLLDDLQASPSLTTLARKLNLRRETVVRGFRADTGTTPMAFLNNARVEYAKSLLKQGVALADAGYQSGFSDQSHFRKIFVMHTAATPGQYRQARSLFDNK